MLYFICSRRNWRTLIWVVKPWQHPEKQVFLSLGPGCWNQSVQNGKQTQSALAMGQSNAWKGPQLCWSSASPRALWDIQHDSHVQLWLNHCNIQFGRLASRRSLGQAWCRVWGLVQHLPFVRRSNPACGVKVVSGIMCVCMGKEITYIAITGFDDFFSYLVVCSLTNTNFHGLASPVLLSMSAFQPHSTIFLALCHPQHR